MTASQQNHAEIVDYLVMNCRADINMRDNAGKRAFDRAKPGRVQYTLSSAAIEARIRNNFHEKAHHTPKQGSLASRLHLKRKPPTHKRVQTGTVREELKKPVLGTFMHQISDDESIAKGLLYKTIKKHLDTVAN